MNSGKIRSNMITGAVGEVCTFFFFFFSPEATGDSTEGNKQPALQTASSILHSNTWIFHEARSIREGTAEFITPTQTATHVPDRSPRLPGARRQPQRLLLFHPRGRSSITECSPSHEGNITLK